jgi:CHAT domain-containing protein/tetratricopeptide (TPR) repeat protein
MAASQEQLTAARRWISRGGRPPFDPPLLSDACDQLLRGLLSTSLKPGVRLARLYHSRAARLRHPDLKLSAARNLARGLHLSGSHREALRHYRSAHALAFRMGRKLDAARIERALADVLMYVNRYAEAEQACRNSARAFRRLGSEADAIQSEVNLANLLHRRDRHGDAAAVYRGALAYFEQSGPPVAEARVCYNLANTLVQMFEWEEALAYYRRAERIYIEQGALLDANDARYGRAYMDLLGDRLATALDELAACEKVYSEEGDPRGQALCHLDMAEAYLGLNLHAEALSEADRARAMFGRLKLRYEHAKSRLFLAYALAGLERKADARRQGRAAARAFERERNRGLSAAVALLLAQLESSAPRRQAALVRTRALFRRAQLPVWSTLCDLQMLAGAGRPQALVKRLAGQPAIRRVPHWSAWFEAMVGEHDYRSGRREAARAHWISAARTLEQARAGLPPIEMRAAYLAKRHDPYRRLISVDLGTHPESAAEWAERLKTAGVWSLDPLVVQEDEAARRLLERWHDLSLRLSVLARSLPAAPGSRQAGAARVTERRMRALEQECKATLRQIESRTLRREQAGDDVAGEMLQLSERLPIVLWHDTGTDLVAFLIRDRRTTVHHYPQGSSRLELELQRWRFFMERHMMAPGSVSGSGLDVSESRIWEELGNWLWKPLELCIDRDSDVLVVPDRALFSLPFAALRPGGEWLGDRQSLIVSPSIRHYLRAQRLSAPDQGMEILDTASDELQAVRLEVDSLAELLKGEPHTIHRPAKRDTLLSLGPARLWHFAGHAQFRADNPFYSSLQLHDAPVFAADLRTRRVAVRLVTLSACHSAGGASAPGEEFSGIVRSLLEMGARSVIAALWPVADESAAHWMCAFYRRWLAGEPLTRALQEAQADTRSRWPSPYHWSAFSLFGSEN